jgi:RimJ/RimL family protein N-acetyltransferase
MTPLREGNIFYGSRIRLTAVRPEDSHMYARWYEDSEFSRLYDYRPAYPRSPARMRAIVEEDDKANDGYPFAIRMHYSEEMIGIVNLDGIAWNHRTGWLGIAIGDPAHRGQGYGTEAMEIVLYFAFREINLHRVQLTVFSYNTGAIRMYERLGFTREGAWRQALHRDGERYDMLMFGLLEPEWAARQTD